MNSIIISGRICNDIEIKVSGSGSEYTNFSVAVDRERKDRDGNKQTDFFKCSVFGKSAAFVSQYFHKGDGITIRGRIEFDKYTDKDGNERTGTTLMAERVEFPPGKGKSSSDDVQTVPTAITGSDKDLPF